MRKFSQVELLNEVVFRDMIAGAAKVAGKAASSALKGAVKMVTPTGADVLRNIRTAVQKGVALFTQEQANVVARKYLQDKYESSGSMFNIKEIGQSKGNLQGRLVSLTEKEKQAEKEQAKAQAGQTTNTSTNPVTQQQTTSTTNTSAVTEQVAPRGLPRPNEVISPNTQLQRTGSTSPSMRQARGRVIDVPGEAQTQTSQPQAKQPQQQQDKIQAQSDDQIWPFRFVFFEADVLTSLNPSRLRDRREDQKSTKDEYRKIKFGVKLTKTTKDGDRQWMVLGLTNPDGSKFTGIKEDLVDNMKVADAPVSFKKQQDIKTIPAKTPASTPSYNLSISEKASHHDVIFNTRLENILRF